MFINSLKLENFRNFEKANFSFPKNSIIIGPNGVGKTNILESIYLLATTKSFRSVRNKQIILWEKKWARIEAGIKKNNTHLKIELILGGLQDTEVKNKTFKIDRKKTKLTRAFGFLKVVFFSPESLEIITGSPFLRRRFLDILISQTNKIYLQNLIELKKVLKNRNLLLLGIKQGRHNLSELEFWNEKLIDLAKSIIASRFLLTNYLNQTLGQFYQEISQNSQNSLRIKYLNRAIENITGQINKKELEEKISQNLFQEINLKQNKEIEYEQTLVGPQRDDLIFVLNNKAITGLGSRGEIRSAMIATKMAEKEFLTVRSDGDPPVLLLDDVYSELDAQRRRHLSDLVSGCQVIITTTDLEHVEPGLRKKAKIIELT